MLGSGHWRGSAPPIMRAFSRIKKQRHRPASLAQDLGAFSNLSKNDFSGHQIQVTATRILEECDVTRRPSSNNFFSGKIVQVAEHILLANSPTRNRAEDVADPVEGGFTPIDKNQCTPRCVIVCF